MPDRARLDAELVRRGLARSRRHAGELIADGRVRVAGAPVSRSAAPVSVEAPIEVTSGGRGPEYASRAGHKLAGALDALGPDGPQVTGRHCLDAGASTGGFTDVLLQRGAAQVTAVDVGHGQLLPRLRAHPQVTARDGVNVRHLTGASFEPRPALVVGDLSFISLTLVLPALADVVAPGGDLLLMVKPQFEVGRERLGAGGVVREPALRAEAVLGVAAAAVRAGLRVRDVVASPLPGPGGNVEYFLWLAAPGAPDRAARVGGTGQDVPDHEQPVAGLRELVERAVAAGPTGEGATWSSS